MRVCSVPSPKKGPLPILKGKSPQWLTNVFMMVWEISRRRYGEIEQLKIDNAALRSVNARLQTELASQKNIHAGSVASEARQPRSRMTRCGAPSPRVVGQYDTGVDKWTRGDKHIDGRILCGPCPECGARTVKPGDGSYSWNCTHILCTYANVHVRWSLGWWVEDILVVRDGDRWMAARHSFVNIQESVCEFAYTPSDAVYRLRQTESL